MSIISVKPFEIGKYVTDGKVIGSGAFSIVCSGWNKETKEKIAIKLIKKEFEERFQRSKKQVKAEIDIMQSINHPNIVQLYEVQRVIILLNI